MFSGIEGVPWSLSEARRALRDSGYHGRIKTFRWKYLYLPLHNLMDYQTNQIQAARVAEQIAVFHDAHPHQPIDLIGYSGGGGLAVLVTQALPEKVKVRNVILVQAALSPTYDLTQALSHVKGRLVNFYAPYDWFILGLGTKTFGTIDRRHVDSAGKVGFDPDVAVPNPDQRAMLIQHPWSREMIPNGHCGGHFSMLFYKWNKIYIAPYLLTDSHPPAHESSIGDAPNGT